MNAIRFEFPQVAKCALMSNPEEPVAAQFGGCRFTARIAIPDYPGQVAAHYREMIRGSVEEFSKSLHVPLGFKHFGLVCSFATPTQLDLYQGDVLCDALKELVRCFGPVFLENVVLPKHQRDDGHRGRFQDLNFHIDRSARQHTQYSLYSRNPDDPEQREPRTASTLFIPNLVAHLQDCRERSVPVTPCEELPNNHTLFKDEDLSDLIGKIIFEQAWAAPAGTGEIGVQFNPQIRHASWYRGRTIKGWPIAVRFLR